SASLAAQRETGSRSRDFGLRDFASVLVPYFCPNCDVKRGPMIRLRPRMIVSAALLTAALFAALPARPAAAQDAPMQISWDVRNRFRLFREEGGFLLHGERGGGRRGLGSGKGVEIQGGGRGLGRNVVKRLLINMEGRVREPCTGGGVQESYLTPTEHPIVV